MYNVHLSTGQIDLMHEIFKGIISNDPIFFVDETIDNICSKHPELIIKTSNDCHTYYNCSGEDQELSRWIPMYHFWPSKYKHECHYPFVFSTKSLRCENYTDVDCGSRFLPTWACKYDRWHCTVMRIKEVFYKSDCIFSIFE